MGSDEVASPLLTCRIVWSALTFSLLVYGFILVTRQAPVFYVPSNYSLLETIALLLGSILFVTYNIHEKKIVPLKDMNQRFPMYVVSWALHESIVVAAFVAVLTGDTGNLFVYVINLVLALFGNVLTFPRMPTK